MSDSQSDSVSLTRLAWMALIAGGVMSALSFGVRSSFGLFMEPISLELGGREAFSLSMAIQNLVWGLMAPIAGGFADKFGPFRVIMFGAVLYIGGIIVMATGMTAWDFHLGAGIMIGVALAGTSFGMIMGAVGQLVPEEKRSWALGIITAAGSLGQFAITPVGQLFLQSFGWSGALWHLAIIAGLMLPLGLVYIRVKPGQGPGNAQTMAQKEQTLGEALSEAFGYASYWYLVLGFFVCGFHVAFIAVHLPAYVKDIGLDPIVGAWAISLVGLFNVIGSYTAGVLGGRKSKKVLLSLLYFGRAAVIAIFVMTPPSQFVVLLFASVMGLLWLSTVPLTSGLVAQIFGVRYMTTLFGIVFLSHQLGSFLGVWLGGRLFDMTGSYDVVWWIGVALGVFSGLVHWPIRENRLERQPA